MAPTQKTIGEVLNIIKSDVALPREKYFRNLRNTNGVVTLYPLFSISVPYILERLNIDKATFEAVLAHIHSKNFISDYRFESRNGTMPEQVVIIPSYDFIEKYNLFLSLKDFEIIVNHPQKYVCVGETKVYFDKQAHLHIVEKIISQVYSELTFLELNDLASESVTRSIMQTIRNHFDSCRIPLIMSVGRNHIKVNPYYLNRFKPQ